MMATKVWRIEIADTGESLVGYIHDDPVVSRKYNPPGGQNLDFPDRDEAVGEVFAILADKFDKERG